VKIGVDLLGSENSPEVLLQATLDLSRTHPFQIHAFGHKIPGFDSVVWHESDSYVSMEEIGVRSAQDKNTSMVKGIEALKSGEIDAFVSCGNTAALLTYSHLLLPKLPQVKRLGLLARIGTKKEPCYVIDVGANIVATVHQLLQFTLIGSATFKALHDKDPRIGILNMATEKGKGPKHLVELFKHLEKNPLFIGFVEPDTLFNGDCDLVITDGFTGNILLKTAEAVAHMTLGNKISLTHFDPSSYPGALLCGAEKLVMKCHGIGDTRALQKTIEETLRLLSRKYLTRVKQEISALKEESF
jgi:glycerol-3-phosphate acyltransferase PlsX